MTSCLATCGLCSFAVRATLCFVLSAEMPTILPFRRLQILFSLCAVQPYQSILAPSVRKAKNRKLRAYMEPDVGNRLSSSRLKELDNSNLQSPPNVSQIPRVWPVSLKVFSRHGGPDLSDLRGVRRVR